MSRKCPTHKIPCAMRLLAFPWDCGTFPPFFLICAGGKYFLPPKRIVFSRARIVGIGESPTVPQVPQNAQSIWKQGLFSVGLSGGTIFKVPRTLLSWPSKGQFIIVVTPPLHHPAADAARRNLLPYRRCALSLYSPCFLCRSDPWTLNAPTEPWGIAQPPHTPCSRWCG